MTSHPGATLHDPADHTSQLQAGVAAAGASVREQRTALLSVASGAVMVSFAPVFVAILRVGPTVAGVYRTAIAATVFGVALLVSGPHPRPTRRALGFAVAAGVFFGLDLILWHRSIHVVGPGLSTILANFQVFILAGVGVVFLGERLSWRLAAAIPLALLGLFLLVGVSWGDVSTTYRAGVGWGLAAAVAYGTYLLLLRAAQAAGGGGTAAAGYTLLIVCSVSTVILIPTAWAEGQSLRIPDGATALMLLAYALSAQVIAWLLITRGLPGVEAGRAGLLLLLQPSLAFVWDVVMFARPTSGTDMAGAAIALGAIYLGTAGAGSTPRSPKSASG